MLYKYKKAVEKVRKIGLFWLHGCILKGKLSEKLLKVGETACIYNFCERLIFYYKKLQKVTIVNNG